MKKRLIVAATIALYVALIGISWVIGTRQAEKRTEAMLDYADSDILVTLDGAIDTMLEHVAVTCSRKFGKVARYTQDEVAAVAKTFDIDELNIVDRTGRIIATNDPDGMDVDMNLKDETRPFSALTNGVTKVVSQPFRRNAYGNSWRKYLGVPFADGDGYIQIGLDDSRMEGMIGSQLAFLFDEELNDTVCYLCADVRTGALVSTHWNGGKVPTLAEIGFDETSALDSGETFEQTLFGQKAFCRSHVFGGYRFIVAVPNATYYGTRDAILAVLAALLAFVLGAFAILLMRISGDADRIKAFFRKEELARAREMDIAKTIQAATLPAEVPDSRHAALAASMTPARDIGGDFYDFFPLDSRHGVFLVADVSGKGITAALYMMTAKTIIKDTLLSEHDISDAITKVNKDLSRNNPANMFLTAWIGVMNLENGRVEFVNAGHNPPVLRKADGSVSWISGKSGPMLAFMDDVNYRSQTVDLSPGDALFLYTDGVTEAMDPKAKLFGEKRLIDTLSVAPSGDPESLCRLVRASVAAFAAGAPAADDLTVLAVKYVSRPCRYLRTFPPTQEGIASASAFLDEFAESLMAKAEILDIQPSAVPMLHVILDEITSNIVKHSGASGFEIDIELIDNPAGVKLLFIDDGVAYDPLTHTDPNTSIPAAERPIGGLGIMMVKKMADSVSYERKLNRNFLSVVKDLHSARVVERQTPGT